MLEKFRDKKYSDRIKITYRVEEDGVKVKKVWEADQQELISRILKIVKEYQQQGITQTLRGYYYDLVGFIPNAIEIYKRIGNLISDLRYSGHIDWSAMEDRARTNDIPQEFENLSELIQAAINSYKLSRWADQKFYVELFSEKDTMYSRLNPLARKYHIPLNINRGYASSSVIYELSKRLQEKIEEGKYVILLYVGDHDPSGLDMINDIEKRVEEFLTKGRRYTEPNFKIVHVALTKEQVEKYKLPPNPAKLSDSRSAKYIEEHGEISWELDALKPQIMIKIVEDIILKYIDMDKYNAWIDREKEEKQEMVDWGKSREVSDDE